jgi:DNA-binding NarL/FixJ family response regulator
VPPTENNPIRVLLIDDHAVVRAGLRLLIHTHPRLRVVGEAGCLTEAVSIAFCEQPDIIVLDLMMGNEDGISYVPRLHEAAEHARIIILTGVNDRKLQQRALQLGAMGLILKEKAPEDILKAIEKVHAGEAWVDRQTMAGLLSELSGLERTHHLRLSSVQYADKARARYRSERCAGTEEQRNRRSPVYKRDYGPAPSDYDLQQTQRRRPIRVDCLRVQERPVRFGWDVESTRAQLLSLA